MPQIETNYCAAHNFILRYLGMHIHTNIPNSAEEAHYSKVNNMDISISHLVVIAFNSVDRHVLWRILALRGIHSKLVNLISGLYPDTESTVRCNGLSR